MTPTWNGIFLSYKRQTHLCVRRFRRNKFNPYSCRVSFFNVLRMIWTYIYYFYSFDVWWRVYVIRFLRPTNVALFFSINDLFITQYLNIYNLYHILRTTYQYLFLKWRRILSLSHIIVFPLSPDLIIWADVECLIRNSNCIPFTCVQPCV